MSTRAQVLRDRLLRGEPVLVRAHGRAGGGLVLALQAFGAALASHRALELQQWPVFPPSRRGGLVTGWLRVARGRVEAAAPVGTPDVVVLVNEEVGAEADFARGTEEALYVLNSASSPEQAGARWRLGGTVVTVDGDELGRRYLGRPLANVAVLAALVGAVGLEPQAARTALRERLRQRSLPERVVQANLDLFAEALRSARTAELPAVGTAHPERTFQGFGALPPGAQTGLRGFERRSRPEHGSRVDFLDPDGCCDGCALCVAQCPESIIEPSRDPAKAGIVRGVRFESFCKVCGECVAACPYGLFVKVQT